MYIYHLGQEKNGLVKISNALIRAEKGFCFQSNTPFYIEYAPFDTNFLPLAAKIENGISNNPHVLLLDYKDNHREIIFLTKEIKSYKSPKAILQKNLEATETVIYNDGENRLCLSSDGVNFDTALPQNLSDFDITNISNKIVLTAKCGEKDYILILEFSGNFSIVCEKTADLIKIENENLVIEENFDDLLYRKKFTAFDLISDFSRPMHRSFVYQNDLNFEEKLVPKLFFEALISEDFNKAKEYLSQSLTSHFEKILQFFGEFDKVFEPKFNENLHDCLALFCNKTHKIRFFKTEIENGSIANFDEV
jgi:hypothetical protein